VRTTTDLVRVAVTATLSKNGKAPDRGSINASVRQCVADAVAGSFGSYPSHLRDRMKATFFGSEFDPQDGAAAASGTFEFGLPADLFPPDEGGFQLLVSFLAGDVFPGVAKGCRWDEVRVNHVDLPTSLVNEAKRCFRDHSAHSITGVRNRFRLDDRRPLLAYSLKPRVGLTFDETREMTLAVLDAGFNIVELDSKNRMLGTGTWKQWLELGVDAARTGRHVTAFSPNLSLPGDRVGELAAELVARIGPYGPPVMKIDGGLDGLTGLQAVRRVLRDDATPIVTSYPVLLKRLASVIGKNTWVDLLALSGADIVYPGDRPTFPDEERPIWGAHVEDWSKAADAYRRLIARDWPMPTIAGGVHAGHLHACYELMGPRVAYFLGGAVALHPRSPRNGALLCVAVLDHAAELADRARRAGAECAEDLPASLLGEIHRAGLDYQSPAAIFRASRDAPHPPRPFYRAEG